ncbi:MAG TPA: hypothetical protein VK573_01160 [Gemmatimonadales bacterium]|nr:hypothetical protein [Gemmatimonadales bacterium]
MSPEQLWRTLRDLFDTDDGSLPEVRILHLEPSDVMNGYALVRSGSTLVSQKAYFWDLTEQREVPLDDNPNAAQLVVSGRAEGFHCVVGGLSVDGGTIPDLGVSVRPDALLLDYRMGPEWNTSALYGLFGLIRRITARSSKATVELEDTASPEVQGRFQAAWREYLRDAGAA